MIYRVQLTPRPIVIDANGLPIRNSHVVEITFPGDTIETMLGRVNTIAGPGVAKIIVGEATIRGVPLCCHPPPSHALTGAMMTDEVMPDLTRNTITAVSERGLGLQVNSQCETAPWAAVPGVSAGRALMGDPWILVLAIEIEMDGAAR